MKASITILISLLISTSIFSQSKERIKNLLDSICNIRNSKNIIINVNAKEIIGFGGKVLPILSKFFDDTTKTNINSECQNFNLLEGEVAIILADRIELMPYFKLTGIQNCISDFCKDNPNMIEYYFSFIRKNGIKNFKQKYITWLSSKDRKKYLKGRSHSL